MKILIVSQYFWPETFTINELAVTLKSQGHEVTVATGKPNYPDGQIFKGYRALGIQSERYDSDIEVLRVPMYPRGSSGASRLLLNYASFVLSGLLLFPFLLRRRRFDAIFVYAASPNCTLPAIPLKWIKRAHLAFWVLDLWPESLSATGYIQNKLLLRAIGWLVRFTYMCADTILVQSRAFIEPIERYARSEKISYFPNSYALFEANDGECGLPVELIDTLESQFCAVFAGNIGSAQAPEVLVDAASHLRDLSNVKVVLVGSGSRLEWVRQAVKKRQLTNVVLAGRFPPGSMPELFCRAACLLVTLKAEQIFAYTVPAKVQAYLAAGRPIVAALNGEGARIVREAKAGLTCEAEDAVKLAACVRALYNMSPEERSKLGEAGKKYFAENFEMSRQAQRLVGILERRPQPPSGPA